MRHTFVLHRTLHLTITITYCSYIYNEVLSCIFKINTKKIETQLILVITGKFQTLQRKILSLSTLSLFESETILSWKIFSEKKKLLLWIYACRLSSHLWFNGRWKSPVAGLNWNPCSPPPSPPYTLLTSPSPPQFSKREHEYIEQTE